MTNPRIAVVGQGVAGLTCAARLLDKNYNITLFSKDSFKHTNSMAAGAYWWPHKAYPKEKISRWALETYQYYSTLCSISKTGIQFRKHLRFCIDPDENAYALRLVEDWQDIDSSDYGIACHYAFMAKLPVVDVPVYMSYLRHSLEVSDVQFIQQELKSPQELFPEFDLVINCTGVDARHFVGDKSVFPIGGQLVRISQPEGLKQSTRLYQQSTEATLILPRTNDVVLGGTARNNDWNRTPDPRDTHDIFQRCSELVPEIKTSKVLGSTVGLRPGRHEVRLEQEESVKGQPVIHNYGHGGSGYTIAWGCAGDVCKLAEQYFSA